MSNSRVGPETIAKLRDYAVSEDTIGFTYEFAAWELGISKGTVRLATLALLEQGIVTEIEPARRGTMGGGAVYAYNPFRRGNGRHVARLFPELDAHRVEADLAQATGTAVPLTGKARGSTHSPSLDGKRKSAGRRVRRPKTKGHS